MTDNGDGTYTGTYTVPLDGTVTVSVFLMQAGGAYAEYFDNIFMDGTPALKRIEPTIDHDWGTGLITNSASDFVSARWYTKIKAPKTEDFFFTVEADDAVRLYFDGELKVERWGGFESCCEDQIFTVLLMKDNFYDIKLEYKEEQGEARVKLYWSSVSVPKQIIPRSYLYYPRYVGSSPYKVTVIEGPTLASKSTATGKGLSQATVGKLAEIDLVSRNFASAPLDNQNDNYEITLVNDDGSNNGNIAFTATYVGAVGKYKATYVPTKAGSFTMEIKLRSEHIKDSPFTVIVKTGDISPLTTTTTITTPISVKAGDTYFFTINAKDLYGSTIRTGGEDSISIFAYFQDATVFASPIGIPDLTTWVLGNEISGIAQDLNDGTYIGQVTILKAAVFTLDVQIYDTPIKDSPFSPLTVTPSEVYAPQSVAPSVPTTAVAGVQTTFQIQGRDFYGNNAATLITSVTSTLVELRNTKTNTLVLTGTITDDATHSGVYVVAFTPTLSGEHKLIIQFEGKQVSGSPFSVTVEPAPTTDLARTTITSFSRTYKTGDYLEFTIEARDAYGNLRTASTSETFIVTLTDADSISTSVTPVSNGDGTYSVSHLLSKATSYTLTVNDATDTTSVANSPYTGIVVSPGDVVALKSVFTLAPNPIPAGTLYTYKVEGRDLYSNKVGAEDTDIQFFLSIYSPKTQTATTHDLIYKFGQYEAELTLNEAGSYDVVIGLIRNGGLRATYYKTVSFYDAIETSALHYHTNLDPTHYTQIDKTIDINSGYLSVLPGMPAQFFSVEWEGKIRAPHSGKFRFSVDSDDYYSLLLKIDSQVLIDLEVTDPGVIHSAGRYYADIILVEGTLYDIYLEYVEMIGKSEVRLRWESDQIARQVIPKEYLYNELYSESTPITLVVQPLPTSASHVVVSGDYAQAVSGVQETITLEAHDIYENLQTHQSDVFSVVLTHVASGTTITATVSPQSNGVYQATYTLPSKGEYSMDVKVQPDGSGSFTSVRDSPFAVTCKDSTTDPTLTQMTGSALTNAFAGEVMSFTVSLFDSQGNSKTTGGDTVTATLYSVGLVSVGSTWVKDKGDGTYTVQYVHDTLGTYTIEVIVNGDTANALTSTITMIAGLPNGHLSTLAHPSVSTIGSATTFSIVAKDAYGNLINSQAYDVAYEIIGNHGLISGSVPVNNLATATYQTSYTIPAPTSTVSSK